MHPNSVFDIVGALLTIALIAMVLAKKNTAKDISATGKTFDSALATAERG